MTKDNCEMRLDKLATLLKITDDARTTAKQKKPIYEAIDKMLDELSGEMCEAYAYNHADVLKEVFETIINKDIVSWKKLSEKDYDSARWDFVFDSFSDLTYYDIWMTEAEKISSLRKGIAFVW